MGRRKATPWLDGIDADAREEALDAAAKLLARRATEAEIGRALGKQFSTPPEAREAVLAAALARLVAWVGVPRSDPRFDSLALCESVVRSNASVRERMAAQARIDELRGEGVPADSGLTGMSDDEIDRQILSLRAETGGVGG